MEFEEWWNISGGGVIHKDPKDAARDAWQSAYMQAYGIGLPEGYVLVPVEPTEKIIDAFWKVVEEDKEARISNVYRAMIQAAQEEE